jgi:hypothetical protein
MLGGQLIMPGIEKRRQHPVKIEIDKPLGHKSENLDTLLDNRVIGLGKLQVRGVLVIQASIWRPMRR